MTTTVSFANGGEIPVVGFGTWQIKGIALDAFLGNSGLLLLLALAVLKPLVTALCLGSSAPGGLLTPTLAIGAALGGFLGIVWSTLWPGTPAGCTRWWARRRCSGRACRRR